MRDKGVQPGAAYTAVRMSLHPCHERFEPVFPDQDIGVYEHIIIGLQAAQGPVVAACESVICIQGNGLYLRELRSEHLQAAVGRGTVGHKEGVVFPEAPDERGEEGPEVFLCVPVEYYYRCAHIIQIS